MKLTSFSFLLVVFLTLGCAHRPLPASSGSPAVDSPHDRAAVSDAAERQVSAPANAAENTGGRLAGGKDLAGAGRRVSGDEAILPVPPQPRGLSEPSEPSPKEKVDAGLYGDYVEEGEKEVKPGIADPLEPFNRAMYHFNDKLYFWVLKPVAQGYQKVVPEPARISVSNFFSNLASPVRFVNCLLQANFRGASTELGRFLVNTVWGIGGLMDPAASEEIKLVKQDEDFGQTLGFYGVGQGFFINWPLLGPSSPRDTVGMAGDFFLYPPTYVAIDWETAAGSRAFQQVNATSLSIGDYESLKEAAIDPYVAIRDAYVQYRLKKVKTRGGNPAPVGSENRLASPPAGGDAR